MLRLGLSELPQYLDDEGNFLKPDCYRVSREGSKWLIEAAASSGAWGLKIWNADTKRPDYDITDEFREYFCTYCFDLELFQDGFEWLDDNFPTPPTLFDHLLAEADE